MREISRKRIEWMINSHDGELAPQELREEGKSIGRLLREACSEMCDEIDRLEQRLRIAQHEAERSTS